MLSHLALGLFHPPKKVLLVHAISQKPIVFWKSQPATSRLCRKRFPCCLLHVKMRTGVEKKRFYLHVRRVTTEMQGG